MTKTIDGPVSGEDAIVDDGEPSRTCADILVEDERWTSVAGLIELVPGLVSEALAEAAVAQPGRIISIALLSDEEIRTLNKTFRAKDAPTNVLSFPSAPNLLGLKNRSDPIFLGDVALAFETTAAEAAAQRKPLLHHAAHLVVHGVLHLAGFDHGEDADADRMETAERLILGRFGIPDPYQDDAMPLTITH